MALRKLIDTDFGVAGEYWRISQTNIDWLTMRAHITLLQYVDEAARRDGKTPIGSTLVEIDVNAIATMPLPLNSIMDVGSIVYSLVKGASGLLADAEDVLDEGQSAVVMPGSSEPTP